MTIDVRRPYAYRVERTDGPVPRTLSSGTHSSSPTGAVTPIGAAQHEASVTRTGHACYNVPLRVRIWPHRGDDEHYRNDPPADAAVFHFPAQPLLDPRRRNTPWSHHD